MNIKLTVAALLASRLFAFAADMTDPEAVANGILQGRLATTPMVGTSSTSVFIWEFDTHLYRSALTTDDKRMKALVAMQVLRNMPMFRKPGEEPVTEQERHDILAMNKEFQLLKDWYFTLSEEDQKNRFSNKGVQAIGAKARLQPDP